MTATKITVAALIACAALVACGPGGSLSSQSPTTCLASKCETPAPTTDAATQAYLVLVNGFWHDHVVATSGALQVCVEDVNPSRCETSGKAMLAVQEKFLIDLGSTAAPPKFAAADGVIRSQLPIANADLNAMIAAGTAGDKQRVAEAANRYIADMQPILEALDQINPAVQHV